MPMKFEHDRMKNGWEVCKKLSIFQKILLPQNPFLKTYMFGQGYSAHACKIWAWSDAKWKSILRKTVIFTENKFFWKFLDPKTSFWKFMFLGKVILHMPIKFEQDRMKNEWVVCKKRPFFQKNNFLKKFWNPNPVFENLRFWARSFCTCL